MILLASLLLLSSTGCRYLAQRAHDWQDSFRVTASAGLGVKAHVQFGVLGFGAGYWKGYEAGYFPERGLGVYETSYFGIPVPFNFALMLCYPQTQPQFIFTHRDKVEGLGSHVGLIHLTSRFYPENRRPPRLSLYWYEIDLRFFVGLRFGVNIAELADFILGFLGLDIMGDDDRSQGG